MTERVALYLQDSHDLRDGLDYAKYAEEKGFEAVWQAESRLVRDAIVPMAGYAAVTNKIKVGSGVINNWTRNIGLLAACRCRSARSASRSTTVAAASCSAVFQESSQRRC